MAPLPTPPATNGLAAIKRAATAQGLDWRPLAAIAYHESGLRPNAVGDQGTSFGLFQLHQGGALPKGVSPQQAQNADWNANFAARQIKALGISGTPEQQIAAISRRFERPADPATEIANATRYYRANYAGQPGAGAPSPAAMPAAAVPGAGSPPAPSLPPLSLAPLQRGFDLNQQQGQRALDALGKISGQQVQTAQAPNLAALTASSQPQLQPTAQHKTIDVPLKGKTPKGLDAAGQKAVELAKHYIGTKYVFGGESPKTGFDCSGLIQYTWGQLGVKIPRVAADQYKVGKPVALNQLQAGDAVFFRNASGIHHVGMALGNGKFLQAPHTGDVVKISSLSDPYYAQQFAGGRRFA